MRPATIERISPVAGIFVGDAGLMEVSRIPTDIVVSAIVGAKGLAPTWAAVERGATVALANKETLVAAGDLVMAHARATGAVILPVDSEHSALFQSLHSGDPKEVRRYILTASGGPFRTWSLDALRKATVEQALRHPTWNMGMKITVDSASLMNKGLEVIEAHHLFNVDYDRIDILVHPQSIVHSLVEFVDGSTIAQLATHDMRLPIQYALTYPARVESPWPRLDLAEVGQLTFERPDFERFPNLRLAYEAGRAGGFAPCVLNAANEVAVEAFLSKRMTFLQMAKLVESVLEMHIPGTPSELNDIVEMDNWARRSAHAMLEKGGWNC
ncbi:1-deoxy-D-xylulose 5-phosphate reductoisomerase [Alicyclobacillus contaminans]|nr:1-deoxy-D-xylulose 5-phosphate reductoisomerase [Alicyclobacillus contaminans]